MFAPSTNPMLATLTYRPPLSQLPAAPIRVDTFDTRRFMNPHPGIWDEPATVPGYWHVSPNGDGAHPTTIVHCSLYIVHCPSYTFSAKERDSETGLSYFGSRYYSSDLSVWLSVDPMASKYPSLSPYTYCANNPVRVVDPDGEEIWIPGVDEKGNVTYTAEKGDNHDSFVKQFDTQGKSREIFKNAGLGINSGDVKGGDVIKGDAVKNATGNEVLKGNWRSMTNRQKAAQLIFAIRYSACRGDWSFDLKDFLNDFQSRDGGQNFSASNVPDGNGGFINIQNISIGCVYDNTVMTTGVTWSEDRLANREMFSTQNVYNGSSGQRRMIMFTLGKEKDYPARFNRMIRCK